MRIRLAFAIAILCANGCALSHGETPKILSFEEVAQNANTLNEGYAVVRGFLRPSSGAYILYRDAKAGLDEDYGSGLDVVLSRVNPPVFNKGDLGKGNCAIVRGKFTAFDQDTIGIGNFRSKIGFLEATRITIHACPK